MATNLNEALNTVDLSYAQLIEIGNDIFQQVAGSTKDLINTVRDRSEILSTDDIRQLMLKLSLNSFSFSEIKEKAALKATLAETIRKTEYSKAFSASTGTNASARDAQATTQVAEEILAEHLYTYVANLLKTTLDESHRVVDTMKSILMSRMSEAKLTQNISIGEPGETYIRE